MRKALVPLLVVGLLALGLFVFTKGGATTAAPVVDEASGGVQGAARARPPEPRGGPRPNEEQPPGSPAR
jgi:hypothetical protein